LRLELDQLLAQLEILLSPWSTLPEQKEIGFFNQAEPWLRIPFYSANYWNENDGLALARIFRYDHGRLIVEHQYFVMPAKARCQKIGKKVLALCLDKYTQMGVKEIMVFAGLSDGGIVWAKVGFKAVDKTEMDAILVVAKRELNSEQYQAVEAIFDLYYTTEPNGTAFPIKDWALLGFMDDILKQVDWHGRIDLTNEKVC
jgi:N-acetylglutamate synthase-like GNAT family acetyltransferase